MKVVTTFIADDGTRFKSEEECSEYERKLNNSKFKDLVLLFDGRGNKLPLYPKSLETCIFIVCKTDEAAEYLYKEFGGWVLPWESSDEKKAGSWIFSNSEYEWEDLKEFLAFADIAREVHKNLQERN